MADLVELARRTLRSTGYVALGTVDPCGRPQVSPLWFTLADDRDVYWLSSPDAHHSRNIEDRSEVSIVVFAPKPTPTPARPGNALPDCLDAEREAGRLE